jgi:hypothetical protein
MLEIGLNGVTMIFILLQRKPQNQSFEKRAADGHK